MEIAFDADCDGALDVDECDAGAGIDTDTDGDCDDDGIQAVDDCDDNDAGSLTVAEDGDCDGTITIDDCDDNDASSTVVAADADCDGTLTGADCDDSDPFTYPGAAYNELDVDGDGVTDCTRDADGDGYAASETEQCLEFTMSTTGIDASDEIGIAIFVDGFREAEVYFDESHNN